MLLHQNFGIAKVYAGCYEKMNASLQVGFNPIPYNQFFQALYLLTAVQE